MSNTVLSLSAAVATLKYEYVFLGFLSNKHLCLMLASSALAKSRTNTHTQTHRHTHMYIYMTASRCQVSPYQSPLIS